MVLVLTGVKVWKISMENQIFKSCEENVIWLLSGQCEMDDISKSGMGVQGQEWKFGCLSKCPAICMGNLVTYVHVYMHMSKIL